MEPINVRGKFNCPKCHTNIEIWYRPLIDAEHNPEGFRSFMDNSLNPRKCYSCGLPLHIDTPTVVLLKNWIGIALENPKPIKAQLAFEIVGKLRPSEEMEIIKSDDPKGLIKYLFGSSQPQSRGTEKKSSRSKSIIVVGRSDELRRIIKNESEDYFCAIRMDLLMFRNWAPYLEMLTWLSDAYLEAEQPEWAYWIYSEAIGLCNELYFYPKTYELLELTATASGNRKAEGLKRPRTAIKDLEIMNSILAKHRIKIPEWYQSTYFCFYEEGPLPKFDFDQKDVDPISKIQNLNMWSTVVDRLKLTKDLSFNLIDAERHEIFVPPQAVTQEELDNLEQAKMYMLILMLIGFAQERLPEIPDDVNLASKHCSYRFNMRWYEIKSFEQVELENIYSRLTDGRSLRIDFARVLDEKLF